MKETAKTRQSEKFGRIEYVIFDPTGNITALVETPVDISDQPAVASEIMVMHPEVEQVGFVTYGGAGSYESDICTADAGTGNENPGEMQSETADIYLRMAGGEFCGNAAMCAAVLYLLRCGSDGACSRHMPQSKPVLVSVSGAANPINVRLRQMRHETDIQTRKTCPAEERSDEGTVCGGCVSFEAAAELPPALSIDEIKFNMEAPSNKGKGTIDGGAFFLSLMNMDKLPLVRLQGIDHIMVEKRSAFYNLKDNRALAEMFIKKWCGMLGSECLGIMFLGEKTGNCGDAEMAGADENTNAAVQLRKLTPLVYVPGADTVFWENSCASGSAAAGMYLAAQAGSPVDVTFDEPAGRLRVDSDPDKGKTVLHGSVMLRQ